LAGIFACRPTSRVILRPEGVEKRTPEEMLAVEALRLQEIYLERENENEDESGNANANANAVEDSSEDKEGKMRRELYCEQHAGLAKMAPRAAIVKIWRELEHSVLRRAAEELKAPPIPARVKSSDAWALLAYCNVIDDTDVSLLEGLERVRNAAASMAPISVEPETALAFLKVTAGEMDRMGALDRLLPGAMAERRRRGGRGVVVRAFSVMPLAKNQRIVAGANQGIVMLTPEVVKQQRQRQRERERERARRAS
jgi:hypothetical protein